MDSRTVRTVYATLASAFGDIESWFTKRDDLLLVASQQRIPYRVEELRRRLGQEPFRTALVAAWRVRDLEGLLSHYIARDSLAQAIARGEQGRINSDDRNRVEFAFARSLGQVTLFQRVRSYDSSRGREEKIARPWKGARWTGRRSSGSASPRSRPRELLQR